MQRNHPSSMRKTRINTAVLLQIMVALAILSGSWLSAPQAVSADTALGNVTTGNGPYSTVVNPVTNQIYIANEQDSSITVVDGATRETKTIITMSHPTAIAVNAVTNKIYVTHLDHDKVSVIDGAGLVTDMIDVGDGPIDIAVNAVTNKIYVANINSDNVTVIDGADNSTETVAAGDEPYRISVHAGTNKIYVANINGDNVTVIDGAGNSTNLVTVGSLPYAIEVNPITNKIYVANQGGNSVTIIDGADNSTETVVAGVSPTHIAVNPVTNKIYVTNQGGNSVTVINGADNSTETVAAGNGPRLLTVNSVTNKIYVANYLGDNITVIDGADNSTKTIATGDGPYGIVVNPVTNQIYVANHLSDTVTVIDGADHMTDTVAAGDRPFGIAVNAVTNKIYISNFFSNTVTVIDGADNTIETVAAGSSYSVAVNEVTNKIYVANYYDNTVTVIDGADNSTEIVEVGDAPFDIAVNPITNKIYVTNQSGDTVSVIDGATNEVETVNAGAAPFGIAVNPIANKIYVSNYGSNDVTIIDGADNTTETVSVGVSPREIAVNSVTNKIYVVNSGNNTVTVIDGADHTTASVITGNIPGYLAVNAKTNKVYVSAESSDTVTVIDGADNSTVTLTAGSGPRDVSVNSATNEIYVINFASSNVTVIDGNSNTTETVTVGHTPGGIAVNEATNRIYVSNQLSDSVTVIDGSGRTPNPLQVEIVPLPDHVASGTNAAFTFRIANDYHPNPTKVLGLYYQLDDTLGEWKRADASGEDWVATVSSATYGRHVLYAMALEAQGDGATAGIASAYSFNLLPENTISPAAASFDKYVGAAAHADITTTLTLNGYPLASIANGATPLARDTDYVVTGNTVTIKKEFLGAQPIGAVNLTFTLGSGATLTLTVTVMDSTPPSGLTAIAGDGQVALSWSGAPDTVTYAVYGGTAPGVYGAAPIGTVSGLTTSYTATGLTNGTMYYFAVVASRASGYSTYSNEASATPLADEDDTDLTAPVIRLMASPTSPTYGDVTVTADVYETGSGMDSLKWSDGARPASYFAGGGTSFVGSFDVSANGMYTVYARDVAGNEAVETIEVTNIRIPDSTPPSGLTAIAGDGQVALSWSGAPDTVTYAVYGGTASGVYGAAPIGTVSGLTTSYTATGLTNGTTYYFAVIASRASGNSLYSNEASATPLADEDDTDLTAPVIRLMASPTSSTYGDVTVTADVYETGSGMDILKWSDGARPASYFAGGGTSFVGSFDVSANGMYTVYARDVAGNEAVETIEVTNIRIPDSTPPSGLTAIAGDGQVALSWSGAPDTVTYAVYGGTASGVYGAAPIGTVSGLTTSYTATGLTNGTTYYFAVIASRASGNSLYSNEASATPLADEDDTDLTAPVIRLMASPTSPTYGDVKVTADVYETGSGMDILKWSDGVRPASYFAGSGTSFIGSFDVSANGMYTVYARDVAGNEAVEMIEVTNIRIPTTPSGPEPDDQGEPLGGPSGDPEPKTEIVLEKGIIVIRVAPKDITEVKQEDGRTVDQVVLPKEVVDKLPKLLDIAERPFVRIVINERERKSGVNLQLPADLLDEMMSFRSDVTFEARLNGSSFQLEVNVLDLKQLAAKLGVDVKDMKVNIFIKTLTGSERDELAAAARQQSMTLLSEAIDFRLLVTGGGQTLEISDFGGTYMMKSIVLDAGVAKRNYTAVLYDPDAQSFTFVPAVTSNHGDSGSESVMRMPHNSIYVVMESDPISFADMQGHWAKSPVEQMAGKRIVEGVSKTAYAPDRAITRAEFTALLVRALGLRTEDKAAGNVFKDVSVSAWFASVVEAGARSGLVNGIGEARFAPEEQITREQMAVMLANARALATEQAVGAGVTANLPGRFSDAAEVSPWARAAIAEAVATGIIQGMTLDRLAPAESATRAQAAVMLKRLMEDIGFLEKMGD
ncbi:S-layer homology domain-containing protein [Paenibacillus mesophilus]|uniref:S-layer homology domain-containing protein n=1 Tax=Paenibacillus mesophilus TaxID=2582849 RepID=UPI00130531B4|nr:S-layer homology domain-containing protein [Paenibacillus mesophilus]